MFENTLMSSEDPFMLASFCKLNGIDAFCLFQRLYKHGGNFRFSERICGNEWRQEAEAAAWISYNQFTFGSVGLITFYQV
jgi:hypothetical protein